MEENFSLRAYLYSLRFYVLFVVALFIGSAVLGYNGILSEIFSSTMEQIQHLIENINGFTGYFKEIFFKNFLTCFFNALFIPLICIIILIVIVDVFLVNKLKLNFLKRLNILLGMIICVFPLFSAFLNGGLIGWFAREEGPIILFAIVPHGLFELPAFFISAAIGLKLGREVLKKEGDRHLKNEFGKALRAFFTLILLLLVIAAIIESALIVLLPLLLDSF